MKVFVPQIITKDHEGRRCTYVLCMKDDQGVSLPIDFALIAGCLDCGEVIFQEKNCIYLDELREYLVKIGKIAYYEDISFFLIYGAVQQIDALTIPEGMTLVTRLYHPDEKVWSTMDYDAWKLVCFIEESLSDCFSELKRAIEIRHSCTPLIVSDDFKIQWKGKRLNITRDVNGADRLIWNRIVDDALLVAITVGNVNALRRLQCRCGEFQKAIQVVPGLSKYVWEHNSRQYVLQLAKEFLEEVEGN